MATKKAADRVKPYEVHGYVEVDVMAIVREAVDEAYPDHEIEELRLDADRFYDEEPYHGQPWHIPVKITLSEI